MYNVCTLMIKKTCTKDLDMLGSQWAMNSQKSGMLQNRFCKLYELSPAFLIANDFVRSNEVVRTK